MNGCKRFMNRRVRKWLTLKSSIVLTLSPIQIIFNSFNEKREKRRERINSIIILFSHRKFTEFNFSYPTFQFHNPIQTQPSHPIPSFPKINFTTIISINFKSAFRVYVTQHPLNCPERITKFTSRRVEAPLTAIQLPHPTDTHTHTVQNAVVKSRINTRIARILQCNTPILRYRPSAMGRVNNLRGGEH